jgi:putative PIN family toxin of toxin-antitoxin system
VRVVLDTDVLVSALHLRSRVAREVLSTVLSGEHHLLTGGALLAELESVLVDTFDWDSGPAHAARVQVEDVAELIHPESVPRVCRDADDDEVLAGAQWGRADVVVTGDKDLLPLGEHAGARIVTPRAFLDGIQHDERKSGPAH